MNAPVRAHALALTMLALPLLAQEPPPAEQPAWPELSAKDKAKAGQLIKTLRATKKPERRDAALAELRQLGPAAAPVLLQRFSDYAKNVNDELALVLDAVTGPEHAPLLALHATDKRAALRTYVLRRLTGFGLPAMLPVFRHALDDEDEQIAFQAALGLTAAGDPGALDRVFARARQDWAAVREPVGAALRGVRGADGTAWLVERLRKGPELDTLTALRLLRTVATKSDAGIVLPFLDSEIHNLKKAAINTLRAIVDGAEPIEDLSVFKAIELANQWKARLG